MNSRRYMAAALTFLAVCFFMLALAVNVDILLTAEKGESTLNPLVMLAHVTHSSRCLTLWLLLDGIGALGIYWALFGRSYLNYRSKMYEVVPGFEIPMPEGQGQHGTAWWMPPDEYGKVFTAVSTGEGVELTEKLEDLYVAERGRIDAVELPKE